MPVCPGSWAPHPQMDPFERIRVNRVASRKIRSPAIRSRTLRWLRARAIPVYRAMIPDPPNVVVDIATDRLRDKEEGNPRNGVLGNGIILWLGRQIRGATVGITGVTIQSNEKFEPFKRITFSLFRSPP